MSGATKKRKDYPRVSVARVSRRGCRLQGVVVCIDERLPKDGGILPVRLFAPSPSISSFFKEPNSAGIFPLSLFQLKFMILALE